MKILFLQDDFPPHAKGGAGIVAAALARSLAERGHEVTVVTAVQDRALVGSFREEGLHIERVYSDYAQRWRSWRSLYNPATMPAIRRILAEVRPEVVHAHNIHYHLSYSALWSAKKSGARVFLTAHDAMLFHYGKLTELTRGKYKVSPWQQLRTYRFWYNPFRNVAIKQLLKSVDRIFAVSAAMQEALDQNGIGNVKVIYTGIDVTAWEVPEKTIATFIEQQHLVNKKVILFGGRISGLKGGGVMLEALREIVRVEPDAVLLLLGVRNTYVEGLIARAFAEGVGDNVISTGWLAGDELHAAYHAAQVVVMPSLCFESFGMIALEAMACGRPVVGSDFGGIPEIVQDGVTGIIVNPRDTSKLAERVAWLLGDANMRETFGSVGRARAEKLFSLTRWCDETLSAYTGEHD